MNRDQDEPSSGILDRYPKLINLQAVREPNLLFPMVGTGAIRLARFAKAAARNPAAVILARSISPSSEGLNCFLSRIKGKW